MSGIEEVNERKIFEGAENRLTHWNFHPSKSYNATILTPRWLHIDTQWYSNFLSSLKKKLIKTVAICSPWKKTVWQPIEIWIRFEKVSHDQGSQSESEMTFSVARVGLAWWTMKSLMSGTPPSGKQKNTVLTLCHSYISRVGLLLGFACFLVSRAAASWISCGLLEVTSQLQVVAASSTNQRRVAPLRAFPVLGLQIIPNTKMPLDKDLCSGPLLRYHLSILTKI